MSLSKRWYDTPQAYGPVSRFLHWSMALLFLWQYASMVVHDYFERGTPAWVWLSDGHKSIGLLLLVLVAVRGVWALANLSHRPPADTGWLGRCAVAGHLVLYALMIVVPAIALLRQFGSGRAFSPFGIPLMEGGGDRIPWMMTPASLWHGTLAWVLLALVAGHVTMALIHQFGWHDGLIQRMWGRVKPSASTSESTGTLSPD